MKTPVFLALTGTTAETNIFYHLLEERVRTTFPDHKYAFLGDPFANYDDVRIGTMRKSELVAPARVCMRWALFYHFNATVVKDAFDHGCDIIVTRRYGYDLYEGAVAFARDCPTSLHVHEALVKFGVVDLGISPPLYLFAKPLDAEAEIRAKRYFSLPNQRRHMLSAASDRELIHETIGLIKAGLQTRGKSQAA